MSNKLPKEGIFAQNEKGEVVQVNRAKLVGMIKKETKASTEWVEGILKLGEDAELNEELEGEERKMAKTVMKACADATKFHFKQLEENKKATEKAKADKVKERDSIVLAGIGGNASAEAFVEVGNEGLFAMVKRLSHGKFEADETGLVPTGEGDAITKKDVAMLIGSLASSTEGLDKVRTSVTFALGDIVLFAENNFEDGAELVQQIANVTGKQKHTIREAARLCRECPKDDRVPGLSATHHQELNNYREAVNKKDPKAMAKIIDTVLEGEVESEVKTADGKTKVQRKVLSCAKTRALLQEASGKKPKKVEKKSGGGFLYVGNADGNVFCSKELVREALTGDYTVIDVGAGAVLNKKGGQQYKIQELDLGAGEARTDGGEPEPKPAPKKGGKKQADPNDMPD